MTSEEQHFLSIKRFLFLANMTSCCSHLFFPLASSWMREKRWHRSEKNDKQQQIFAQNVSELESSLIFFIENCFGIFMQIKLRENLMERSVLVLLFKGKTFLHLSVNHKNYLRSISDAQCSLHLHQQLIWFFVTH